MRPNRLVICRRMKLNLLRKRFAAWVCNRSACRNFHIGMHDNPKDIEGCALKYLCVLFYARLWNRNEGRNLRTRCLLVPSDSVSTPLDQNPCQTLILGQNFSTVYDFPLARSFRIAEMPRLTLRLCIGWACHPGQGAKTHIPIRRLHGT
jgi:hypothetical protein